MNRVAERLLAVCPLATAALLLLARQLCEQLGLPAPGVTEILAATKVSRTSAYDLVDDLVESLFVLAKPRGRPAKPRPEAHGSEVSVLQRAVLAFVMRHPGCARTGARQGYSDRFRHFIIEQRTQHEVLALDVFARAVGVPLGTLKDWLRAPVVAADDEGDPPTTTRPLDEVQVAHLQTVLAAYPGWDGTFLDFCEHVRRDLHVPFGRTLIDRILTAEGLRHGKKRGRQTADELALRGAFKTFFPGAQWVGDGMQVPVVINDERFSFNLELNVDAHTGACVGMSVRDEEDSPAVVEAFADGVATTGEAPLALLLDNKPSNHTPDVDAALGDTLRLRATPGRAQNKAHVEGAFGLFSQSLPGLSLDTRQSAHDLARDFLALVGIVWGRTTNHRPRADRGGRSRVELYAHTLSQEQLDEARRELAELVRRQELARRTIAARTRPDVLAMLDEYFERHELVDPERHLRLAIARYPMSAIVDGLAVFEGKHRAQTLPDGVDARYLFGIVRNIAAKMEGEHIATAMLELRLAARDRTLARLVAERVSVCAEVDPTLVSATCVDRALATASPLERAFWLGTVVDVLRARPETEQRARFLAVARRISATFAVTARERQDAIRFVADRLVPLA